MDSNTISNQMQQLINTYKSYAPTNPNDVLKEVSNRVGNLAPQFQELAGYSKDAYTAPGELMQNFQNTYGNEAEGGLSSLARLNSILQQTGNKYAMADATRNVINQEQGNLKDIANSVTNQYNAQKSGIMDQYSMLSTLLSAALQKELSGKGGNVYNFGDDGNDGDKPPLPHENIIEVGDGIKLNPKTSGFDAVTANLLRAGDSGNGLQNNINDVINLNKATGTPWYQGFNPFYNMGMLGSTLLKLFGK